MPKTGLTDQDSKQVQVKQDQDITQESELNLLNGTVPLKVGKEINRPQSQVKRGYWWVGRLVEKGSY